MANTVGAQQADPPSADDLDVALSEVIRLRARPQPDAIRLQAAVARFQDAVRASGPDVVEHELALVGSADARRSARAQLVLAQVRQLPDGWSVRLPIESVPARVYAALREGSTAPMRSDRLRTDRGALDALDVVAPDLAAKLALSDVSLARANPEFAVDYRRECAPRLSVPSEFVGAEQCRWADLDGDGAHELVAVCDSVWQTFWLHDVAFVAVVQPGLPAGSNLRFWRLPVGASVRVTRVLDLDGDGTSEVLVWVDIDGGRAPFGALLAISRHGMASLPTVGGSDSIRILSMSDELLIVANAGTDWSFPGGAATERCGALATRYTVARFRAGAFEPVTSVLLPIASGTQ